MNGIPTWIYLINLVWGSSTLRVTPAFQSGVEWTSILNQDRAGLIPKPNGPGIQLLLYQTETVESVTKILTDWLEILTNHVT